METRVESDAPASTRERILEAAALQFSTHAYEDAGLREIAAAAKVDVAYVHRLFGSKENLFRQTLRRAIRFERIAQASRRELPRVSSPRPCRMA